MVVIVGTLFYCTRAIMISALTHILTTIIRRLFAWIKEETGGFKEFTKSVTFLIDTRNDFTGYQRRILIPILAVLPLTFLLITTFTMNEKDTKVQDVEIGED